MRIVHLDSERGWRGGEAQLLHLAKGLSRRGHHCFVMGQPNSPLIKRTQETCLSAISVKMSNEFSPSAILSIAQFLKRNDIEVIHMHSSRACGLGMVAARISGTPVRIISRRVDFPLKSNPFRKLKYQWGVDRIIAVSNGVRDILIRYGMDPNRIQVIHKGIFPIEK